MLNVLQGLSVNEKVFAVCLLAIEIHWNSISQGFSCAIT